MLSYIIQLPQLKALVIDYFKYICAGGLVTLMGKINLGQINIEVYYNGMIEARSGGHVDVAKIYWPQ